MPLIVEQRILAPRVSWLRVAAPEVAAKAEPGQFVMVRLDEKAERIPLTIVEADREEGTIVLVIQEVGRSTADLVRLRAGDTIRDLLGPLGRPTEIERVGTVVCVGGGIGVAPILPQARRHREVGNRVLGIIGAQTKELLILEEEMRAGCERLLVTTDDGSYGRKGLVTDALAELLAEEQAIASVTAIGPVPMMQAVAELTRPYGIKTIVSLNPIMVDGSGMCGSCRVTVAGATKFACVDGPEFDGHAVDFVELRRRQSFYREEERRAVAAAGEGCRCRNA
ncbi:MAG: sulfide/dihydroorotate dehydrogenase-like FAD/NAD-binding protein [Firmicutes bacterium]|nr:sulfide/dihydroorotate dehydrogenase-like FAD/NAD-binding protein [Bacillota bacterium]